MNIKALLIGSAAAITAVSGAQAADAIVAAEPEAVEYVRVCDTFGAGFFYIPGSETCLKVGGYVRFQADFKKNASVPAATTGSDWNTFTRAQVELDARSETDLGTLRSFIALRGNAENGKGGDSGVFVHEAFIDVAGFRVGKFFSIWDNGISGETDQLSNETLFNSIRYTYDAGVAQFGLSVDELDNVTASGNNNVGLAAHAAATIGGVNAELLGGYDFNADEYAIRGIATVDVGPGAFGLAAVYASAANVYYDDAEWTVAAEYAVNVTEKLKLTPGVQYFNNFGFKTTEVNAWKAGLTADYAITSGLTTKVSAQYIDEQQATGAWEGFVRLQRSF